MKEKLVVQLEGLGICEHCREVVSVEDFPVEATDATWRCPTCKKVLTHRSFGYQKVRGEFQKVRWVGRSGKWTAHRPERDFTLGNFDVVIEPLPVAV